ncbi:MAG TPA: HAD family hydrolase [Caldithrix abyssi]|uniref:phosphoglycolate phosphatase n=1 Tax=Caldithrix abyssi TaxID=187145 RepID=A0A7V4WVJ7_CALAY|nr:HAD family hydrolase [Caldithrix abyssi]
MHSTLVLFDIDGTLLTSRGLSRRVFKEIMLRRFPHFENGFDLRYSGMTDPQIVETILEMNHFPVEERAAQTESILTEFVDALCSEIYNGAVPALLPGVKQLVDHCVQTEHCYLGLVTGNMMQSAQAKLRAVDLYEAFPLGAFGNDSKHRTDLPPLAIARAQKYYRRKFETDHIWVIGDSIHDVRCAHAAGIHSLAVASGVTNMDDLQKENPDFAAENLEDYQTIVKWLGIKK